MKVILAVILAISSATAIGSGPYLPSGWRPKGPAFYLPSEVQKPADNPIKEPLVFETEALGSEGLREYGPPKEALSVQALPDVVTEQTFYVVDSSALVEQQQAAEVKQEQRAETVQETTESVATEVEIKIQDSEVTATLEAATEKVEAATEKVEIATEQVEIAAEQVEIATEQVEIATEQVEIATEQVEIATEKIEAEIVEAVTEVKEVEATVVAVEDKLKNIVAEEEKLESIVKAEKAEVVEPVVIRNIAEALVNIENEIKAEQIQQSIEAVNELKTTEKSESAPVPEGFLEYGPPGFREYGPPKEELARSDAENEVRRRRFSPKFRSTQNKKH